MTWLNSNDSASLPRIPTNIFSSSCFPRCPPNIFEYTSSAFRAGPDQGLCVALQSLGAGTSERSLRFERRKMYCSPQEKTLMKNSLIRTTLHSCPKWSLIGTEHTVTGDTGLKLRWVISAMPTIDGHHSPRPPSPGHERTPCHQLQISPSRPQVARSSQGCRRAPAHAQGPCVTALTYSVESRTQMI